MRTCPLCGSAIDEAKIKEIIEDGKYENVFFCESSLIVCGPRLGEAYRCAVRDAYNEFGYDIDDEFENGFPNVVEVSSEHLVPSAVYEIDRVAKRILNGKRIDKCQVHHCHKFADCDIDGHAVCGFHKYWFDKGKKLAFKEDNIKPEDRPERAARWLLFGEDPEKSEEK